MVQRAIAARRLMSEPSWTVPAAAVRRYRCAPAVPRVPLSWPVTLRAQPPRWR